jgi:hypothetical protein
MNGRARTYVSCMFSRGPDTDKSRLRKGEETMEPRRIMLWLGGLMMVVGVILLITVMNAPEIRSAESTRALYGFLLAVVGLVVALVAKIFISQRG